LNFDFPTYEAMVQAHWNSQSSWNSSFVGPSDGPSGSGGYSLPYPDPLRQLLGQYPGLYQSPIEAFYGAREWDQALAAAPTVLADLALTGTGEMVFGLARDAANVLTYGVESAQGYGWNSQARQVSWSAATWSAFGLALTFTPVGLEERTMLTLERNVAKGAPRAYSVAFETQLAPAEFAFSSRRQMQIANNALRAERSANPTLANFVSAPQGWGEAPEGWIWHHATFEQANSRFGVLQLVPEAQHTSGSQFWPLLHPENFGGYWQWAVPAGAPPR
jgi:hypothetical protein